MSKPNIERGDTFYMTPDRYRGAHFTCVGVSEDEFFAGDTNGRMYRFTQHPSDKYEVYFSQGPTWRYEVTVSAETIVKE